MGLLILLDKYLLHAIIYQTFVLSDADKGSELIDKLPLIM